MRGAADCFDFGPLQVQTIAGTKVDVHILEERLKKQMAILADDTDAAKTKLESMQNDVKDSLILF